MTTHNAYMDFIPYHTMHLGILFKYYRNYNTSHKTTVHNTHTWQLIHISYFIEFEKYFSFNSKRKKAETKFEFS